MKVIFPNECLHPFKNAKKFWGVHNHQNLDGVGHVDNIPSTD